MAMKLFREIIFTLSFLGHFIFVSAQCFYFEDTVTYIENTTDASPIHWYLEVYNNVNKDTTLRWKVNTITTPQNWVITFDDQNSFHSNIQVNDSSDFTLFEGLSFPQKLIIGAFVNNTPGSGVVSIDVFDPSNDSNLTNIQYYFTVTTPTTSISTISNPAKILDEIQLDENRLSWSTNLEPCFYEIYSIDGKRLAEGNSRSVNLTNFSKGTYVLRLFIEERTINYTFLK